MEIYLIRHLKTKGNVEHRYIGTTDESLIKKETQLATIEQMQNELKKCQLPDMLISSPLKRCLQTSNLIYPQHKPIVVDNLREIDFGDFENKTHLQLENNPDYIRWIESNGISDIPNGESFNAFTDRCVKGFKEAVDISKNNLNSAFVIHGGTMMALLTALTGENFYTTVPKNGLGFVIKWENNEVKDLKTLV